MNTIDCQMFSELLGKINLSCQSEEGDSAFAVLRSHADSCAVCRNRYDRAYRDYILGDPDNAFGDFLKKKLVETLEKARQQGAISEEEYEKQMKDLRTS